MRCHNSPRRRFKVLICKLRGHKWRDVRNPVVFECERCAGKWEQVGTE